MISVTQLRSGVCFVDHEEPWRVMTYKHTHISRGSGTIKVKCKNLKTGNVLAKTFKSGDKVEDILVTKERYQYLYQDGEEYVFMNQTTFEQVSLEERVLGDDVLFLKEGGEVDILVWDETPLALDLPAKINFKVTEAAPGERGDSASNVYKDAVLENGLKVRVPLFINAGDTVRIDTRDKSYVERVNLK